MRKLLVLGFALALTALFILGDAHGQSYTLTLTIPNPAPAASDEFGYSVAAVGGNILVGAIHDDPSGVTDAGSAYVFDGTSGALLLTIPNPAPAADDGFGNSVAPLGGNILVGANMDDPGGVPWAGSAYLFDGTTGALLLTIPNPTPGVGDRFGSSVAPLGGNILVGGPLDDPGGVAGAGSAYLFDGTTGALLLTIPNPAPADGDRFGASLAALGGNILVGAHWDNPGGVTHAGSAYLFDGATGALLLTIPNPTPAAGDYFGARVAAVGGNILVGAIGDQPGGVAYAGSAYLFDGTTGALLQTIPNPTPADGDQFGTSVAAVGGNILVGAIGDDPGGVPYAGSAYLFDGTTGALLQTIPNPTPADGDSFGTSVAAVGGNILVGAWRDDQGGVADAGSAYLFATEMDSTPPAITLTTPAEGAIYTLNQVVLADYTCEDDEPGGSGLASCVGDVPDGAAIDTASVGPNTFTVAAEDNAGNIASLTQTYSVVYSFSGFFRPVDNAPTLNLAKAGSGVPVKFSLGGDQGVSIFATGYPKSLKITCDTSAPLDDIEETVTAGSSSLSYDPIADQYVYVWKTDKAWAGTCRQLMVRLADLTDHVANFKFK